MNDVNATFPNRRTVFRVPVYSGIPLESRLFLNDGEFEGKVINIGLCGVSIRVQQSIRDLFLLETDLSVELSFRPRSGHSIHVVCAGLVRRNTNGNLGIHFPEHILGNDVHPPASYRQLVMDVQREFNRRRRNAFD